MGVIRLSSPVRLIAAICYLAAEQKESALVKMKDAFGPVLGSSAPFEFNFTTYYEHEMGSHLKKQFFSFLNLVDPSEIPDIKIKTNDLEKLFAVNDNRTVNIDPGYIEAAKLVLATTKNYNHRIYIAKGIYGDVQLFWQNGRFHPNPWTYPDYKQPDILDFFASVRNSYFAKIKKEAN
ncbi:DUF4416 family protein [candidate division KSB1 bacterium]|nr:DUF4416 family protein [candidate division KSB1 bacterium]RQW00484.1 MAG: DUF4416 family protein [candidate division KSB1 bacterium]